MKIIVAIIGLVLVAGCAVDKGSEKNHAPTNYRQGEILFKGNAQSVKEAVVAEGVKIVGSLRTIDDQYDLHKIKVEDLSEESFKELVAEINSAEGVEFAEPNYILKLGSVQRTKDPFWLQQWALNNVGQDAPSGSQGERGADIGALEAWSLNKGSKEIVVGVIDTGIDYKHPDLKPNMWVNKKEKEGLAGVDDDGNGYADDVYGWNFISNDQRKPYYGQLGQPDPMDDNNHGSHCAGIIGAAADNSKGIAGVNWNVRLMALKFLSAGGSGSVEDAYRAVIYGIENGADVLSNSWGGGPHSRTLAFAVKRANDEGVLFVAAAGNDGTNNDVTPHFPSNYKSPNVISVAASDNKDRLASFSNYGVDTVDIAAPGVSIVSTVPTSKNGTGHRAYKAFSGTSMATPYVAGAAALLLAHESSLRGQPEALKKRLLGTVDKSTYFSAYVSSGGRLNVARALKNDLNPERQKQQVISENYDLQGPRYPTEKIDHTWVIKKEGVKRLRVNFEWVMADVPQYDVLAIYDKSYGLVHNFEAKHPMGFTSPWVEGDTLRIRFANAVVDITEAVTKIFKSPAEGFKAGATICQDTGVGSQVSCTILKSSGPTANFASRGFLVQSIEYVK